MNEYKQFQWGFIGELSSCFTFLEMQNDFSLSINIDYDGVFAQIENRTTGEITMLSLAKNSKTIEVKTEKDATPKEVLLSFQGPDTITVFDVFLNAKKQNKDETIS